jgi:DNA repair protein RadA/Sms
MSRKSQAAQKQCRRCGNSLAGSQCVSCGLWNLPNKSALKGLKTLADVVVGQEAETIPCGRWGHCFSIRGGLVPGTLTVIGGSPGAGKSTLLLHLVEALDCNITYVCAEESEVRIKERADRIGISVPRQKAVTPIEALGGEDVDLAVVLEHTKSRVAFIDSISLLEDSGAAVGSCKGLKAFSEKKKVATILTAHVNKEGGIAGLMALQHVVDCTMTFFPDEAQPGVPRVLHVEKNRNGPAYISQVFLMKENGLEIIGEHNAMDQLER